MSNAYLWGAIAVTALVTYLTRVLPFMLFRQKITNSFIRSFLYYVPYAVLTAMILPAIFTSTSSVWSAAVGLAVAVGIAFWGKSLLTVALSGSAAVFIAERVLDVMGRTLGG